MIKGTRDGIQIAEWLRKNRQIPFLFLTSLTDRATLDRAKTTLPYGYIVKPLDEKDLLTSIEMALYKFSQEMDSMKLPREKLDSLASEPLTDREYEILDVYKRQALTSPDAMALALSIGMDTFLAGI